MARCHGLWEVPFARRFVPRRLGSCQCERLSLITVVNPQKLVRESDQQVAGRVISKAVDMTVFTVVASGQFPLQAGEPLPSFVQGAAFGTEICQGLRELAEKRVDLLTRKGQHHPCPTGEIAKRSLIQVGELRCSN